MKHLFFLLILAFTHMVKAQSLDLSQWTLVFDDEFNTDSTFNTINPNAQWITGYQWEGAQTHGNEPEYYTRYNKNFTTTCNKGGINHFINGGVLSLQARKEPNNYYQVFSFPNGVQTSSCSEYNYTSGMLYSKEPFKYGYFEISCKIPDQGMVLWPAFWLYSADPISGADPSHGTYREVDVFEFIGNTPDLMGTNVHMTEGLYTGNWSNLNSANVVGNDQYSANLENTDITNQFHTYAVKWSQYSVVWYFDGVPVRTEIQEVPLSSMYIIVNLALDPSAASATTDAVLPANMEIDYIRAYQTKYDFHFQSGNNNGAIGNWTFNVLSDQLLPLDYNGDGIDEVQAVSNTASQTLGYSNGAWQTLWTNSNLSSNSIGYWSVSSTDKFVAGDFDGNGSDEIQCLGSTSASTDWSQTLKYISGTWHTIWSNPGNDIIGTWHLNPPDKFITGDFNGDGIDEIQCFNTTSASIGSSQTLKYINGSWQTIWSNTGNDVIANWNMNPPDKFVTGDFNGDGIDEIQCFSPTSASTDWSQTLKYINGSWQTIWSNTGNDVIAYWNMNSGDKYNVLDFNGDGTMDILCTATNGWAQVITYTNNSWQTIWENDGSNKIAIWSMDYRDQYVTGKFSSNPNVELLALSITSYHHEIGVTAGVSNPNLRIMASRPSSDIDQPVSGSAEDSVSTSNVIFPNPISSGILNFKKKVDHYNLFNMTGQILLEGNNASSMNIDGLAKGLYILNLDGKSFKFIVE